MIFLSTKMRMLWADKGWLYVISHRAKENRFYSLQFLQTKITIHNLPINDLEWRYMSRNHFPIDVFGEPKRGEFDDLLSILKMKIVQDGFWREVEHERRKQETKDCKDEFWIQSERRIEDEHLHDQLMQIMIMMICRGKISDIIVICG